MLLVLGEIVLGQDGLDGTLWLAEGAIDAFFRIDDQEVWPFMKAIDGANLDAIRIFTFDTALSYNKGHTSGTVFRGINTRYVKRLERPLRD